MIRRLALILLASGLFVQTGQAQRFLETPSQFSSPPPQDQALQAVTVADFNSDGRSDVYIPGRLYRQREDGTFVDILDTSGLQVGNTGTLVALPADPDADGLVDLLLLNSAPGSRYYANLNAERYQVANSDRSLNIRTLSVGASWGDYDLDGLVDLFVASRDGQHQLYLLGGDDEFVNVSGTKRTASTTGTCGLAVADYDRDLDLDVYLPACTSWDGNRMLRYDATSDRYLDRASNLRVVGANLSPAAVFLDFDNDGWMDLFVLNARQEMEFFDNNLYRNLDGLQFEDVADQAGVTGVLTNQKRTGVAAADFDNDGWTDLYISAQDGPHRLYLNQRDGTFREALRESIARIPPTAVFTAADVNDDGWIDLIYGEPTNLTVFENTGGEQHWVKIALRAGDGNRLGLGARVEVRTGELVQTRQNLAGAGNPRHAQTPELHFGLDSATTIHELVVTWPDGQRDVLTDLTVDRRWTIAKGGFLNDPPSSFDLASPPDAAFFDTTQATIDFSWEPARDDGSVEYTLSITGLGTRLTFPGITGPSISVSSELMPRNFVYSWSVVVSDGLSTTPGRGTRAFTFGSPDRATATLAPPSIYDFGLPPLARGDAQFLDMDGDLDLDLVLVGETAGFPVARLYKTVDEDVISGNDGSLYIFKRLENTGSSFDAVYEPSLGSGDLEGDGDTDLVLTGLNQNSREPSLTIYSNADGSLMSALSPIEARWGGPVTLSDVDLDGDGDLLVSGSASSEAPFAPETVLYRNTGGAFEEWARFPGAMFGSADWFDADMDGDLDLALVGEAGSGHLKGAVYRNDGDSFTEVAVDGLSLAFASLDWADYDNDGDGDLVAMGGILSPELMEGRTVLLRQEAPWSFVQESTALDNLLGGSVAWGDYENDGDLDILVTGARDVLGTTLGRVFRNQDGRFVAELDFPGTIQGRVSVGDYNLDGDLDFLVFGLGNNGEPSVSFFINQQVAEPVPATR